MTENLRIIKTNDADSATLSSGDFVASLPVGNLQIEGRSRVARTTNATGDKVILGEWPTAQVLSACVLYRHNLTSAATWRLEAFDAAAQAGTKVLDTGVLPAIASIGWGDFGWGLVPWGADVFQGWPFKFSNLWFTSVAAISFRITISDPLNPAGYIQAKRLLLGNYFSPAVNADYGLTIKWDERSQTVRTQAGSLRSFKEANWRQLSFNLAHLTETESADLLDIARTVGTTQEFFISVFPEAGGRKERDCAMLGKFPEGSMPENEIAFWDIYSQHLTIIEA